MSAALRKRHPGRIRPASRDLTRLTCAPCHLPPSGVDTPSAFSRSAAFRAGNPDSPAKTLASPWARSFASCSDFKSLVDCRRRCHGNQRVYLVAHSIIQCCADAGGISETQTTKRIAMTLSKRARLFRQRQPQGSNAPAKRDWNFEARAPRDDILFHLSYILLHRSYSSSMRDRTKPLYFVARIRESSYGHFTRRR
jgi:hypothetical protein